MFRKKARTYSAALLVYLVVITLLRWPLQWEMALFWLGSFFGLLLYNLDHVAYLLWQEPQEPTAIRFKELMVKRRFKEGLTLLDTTCSQRKRLVGHSVVFQAVLVILTYFAVSSTASFFGRGLAIGLFFYSLVHQGLLLAKGENLSSWFWQVDIKLTPKGEALYFLALLIILFYFSWMLV